MFALSLHHHESEKFSHYDINNNDCDYCVFYTSINFDDTPEIKISPDEFSVFVNHISIHSLILTDQNDQISGRSPPFVS